MSLPSQLSMPSLEMDNHPVGVWMLRETGVWGLLISCPFQEALKLYRLGQLVGLEMLLFPTGTGPYICQMWLETAVVGNGGSV